MIASVVLSLSCSRCRRGARRPRSGCVDCHLALDDARLTPPAKAFAEDVHAAAGFTCVFCHGGDASARIRSSPTIGARDSAAGSRRATSRRSAEVPCRRGADEAVQPSLRVDQLAEYRSSGHGTRSPKGDASVAQCASCHGAHGILPVKDSRSPGLPDARSPRPATGAMATRRSMAAHKLPSDVYAKYSHSVHFAGPREGRPVGAVVQLLPRQPRRRAARSRLGRQRLRDLPRGLRRSVQAEPSLGGVPGHGPARLRHLPREPRDRPPHRGLPGAGAVGQVRLLPRARLRGREGRRADPGGSRAAGRGDSLGEGDRPAGRGSRHGGLSRHVRSRPCGRGPRQGARERSSLPGFRRPGGPSAAGLIDRAFGPQAAGRRRRSRSGITGAAVSRVARR